MLKIIILEDDTALYEGTAHASSNWQSVNGLVNALLRADMGLTEDEWKQPPEDAKKAPNVDTEPWGY